MKTSNRSRWWYPFRSQDVKDIYDHLTDKEYEKLRDHGREAGGGEMEWMWFPVVVAFAGPFIVSALPIGTQCILIFAFTLTAGLLGGYFGGKKDRQRTKEILCSTQFAIQKGFTPKTLKFFSFQK